MTAHWVVLAAAALTTLVAAAVGAALAAFAGQALPQAVRHDLVVAPGTSLVAAGSIASRNPAQTSAALRSSIAAQLGGVPFSFWPGIWSNPLSFEAGSRPASSAIPRRTGSDLERPAPPIGIQPCEYSTIAWKSLGPPPPPISTGRGVCVGLGQDQLGAN